MEEHSDGYDEDGLIFIHDECYHFHYGHVSGYNPLAPMKNYSERLATFRYTAFRVAARKSYNAAYKKQKQLIKKK
jgi:hypothetical protein